MEYPISLYYDTEVSDIKTLDLCRGDDDYRKVYIVDDGNRKLVIKYLSNTFSDKRRIEGWFKLMDEYRKIGLYCPAIVPNCNGELLHCDTVDGRDYYTYQHIFDNYTMGTAFLGNALLSLNDIVESGNCCNVADKLIFPILFNTWHGLELWLKSSISAFRLLVREEGKIYSDTRL